MVHGIPAHGGPEWSHRAQPQRASARAATIDAEINRTGALQVTTDDGDSVTISFAALQQLHAESFRGKAGGAKIAYGNESQTSGVSVNISVDGSLDEQEVADIGELLQQLSSAVQDPSATPDTAQLAAQLPPKERRALVLIDPPFEDADEFPRLAAMLPEVLRRFDSGVYAIWYPVKRQRDTDNWHARIARSITQPTLAAELWLHPRDTTVGLNGSGLLIVNPPWQMDLQLATWQEELRGMLGAATGGGSHVKWIIHERS